MYSVDIIADSVGPHGIRLTTFKLTYPRFAHDEFLTHRELSRNTSSNRAIPVNKMISQLLTDPVIPVEWGKNESGMVAGELLSFDDAVEAENEWLQARVNAVESTKALLKLGVHKQLANRLSMAWQWTTTIASATNWENFFFLRTAKDAQPEIQTLAKMMVRQYYLIGPPFIPEPVFVDYGEWHLPFVTPEEKARLITYDCIRLSCARCASVSYLRQEDQRPNEKWFEVYDKLVKFGHWSPLEHAATPVQSNVNCGNFRFWKQARKLYSNEVRHFTKQDAINVLAT